MIFWIADKPFVGCATHTLTMVEHGCKGTNSFRCPQDKFWKVSGVFYWKRVGKLYVERRIIFWKGNWYKYCIGQTRQGQTSKQQRKSHSHDRFQQCRRCWLGWSRHVGENFEWKSGIAAWRWQPDTDTLISVSRQTGKRRFFHFPVFLKRFPGKDWLALWPGRMKKDFCIYLFQCEMEKVRWDHLRMNDRFIHFFAWLSYRFYWKRKSNA